jgi:2-polyprenyl-6-methoxyphenol hydroxylase-like FAD-dependent oxidoreductase
MSHTYRHGHAIVIGASIAGLLAARVLADHFERVTVIDRDNLDENARHRRGVPQDRHAHALLSRGQHILGALFPDLVSDMVSRGATQYELGRDLRWHHFGVWKSPYEASLNSLSASRPFLEQEIRRRVRKLHNVALVGDTVVTRYLADWERARITGVCVRGRHAETLEDEVHADLVVDAGGRGSQTPQRLKELGYVRPREAHIRVGFEYATREFERPHGARNWLSLYVLALPPSRRGGLVLPIEGNRWIVTLFGARGDHPPADDEGFLKFAKSLPVPDLHDALVSARPVSDIATHHFPASQRRYYEELARFPAGLIVMGDALCSFNPIFGQGMTTGAMQAELLGECLRELDARRTPSLEALTCNFRERVARVVDQPWQLATSEDLRFPQTPGSRSLQLRFMHWYTARLNRAAGKSALITERFHRVTHLLAPRSTLFGGDVLAELLRVARQTPAAREHHQHDEGQAQEC